MKVVEFREERGTALTVVADGNGMLER